MKGKVVTILAVVILAIAAITGGVVWLVNAIPPAKHQAGGSSPSNYTEPTQEEVRRDAAKTVPLATLRGQDVEKRPAVAPVRGPAAPATQPVTDATAAANPGTLSTPAQAAKKANEVKPLAPVDLRRPDDKRVAVQSPTVVSGGGPEVGPVELLQPTNPKGGTSPSTLPTGGNDSGKIPVVTLKSIHVPPPPLEAQRKAGEATATDTVKIVTGFECSTPLEIQKISSTHFAVKVTTDADLKNWFMFRLEGVKGQTVRIDIKGAPINKWWSLNPVYSSVPSLDEMASFVSGPATTQPTRAHNGPLLPDTSGQKWHYIANVWNDDVATNQVGTYSFVQRFNNDGVVIAMRPPYTPKLNEAYLESLRSNPAVKIHEIGRSKAGRNLFAIQIGEGDLTAKPCVVMYAREHANEHDGSWAVQGAIESLLGDNESSRDRRQRFTFILIPLLDPDGAVNSKYESITHQFIYNGKEGPEAIAYASFFRKWIEAGNRLDLVYNFHNVESAETNHVMSVVKEAKKARVEAGWVLDESYLRQALSGGGFEMASRGKVGGNLARYRLGGYISFFYGPLHMPYELNSQCQSRHLTLSELRGVGATFIAAGTTFLASDQTSELQASIAETRRARDLRFKTYSHRFRTLDNPLQIEWVPHWHDEAAKSSGKTTTLPSQESQGKAQQ